jgi:fumarate hydratase subunit beta
LSEYRLRSPLAPADAAKLRIGDTVFLDGEIVTTAGFATHERLMATIAKAEAPPIDLKGAAFFHMGSCSVETPDGMRTEYVNPTTSTRFNKFMPTLIRHFGFSATAGKGGLDQACVEALKETGSVYFSMIGGAATLLTGGISRVIETGWDDLIMQFRLTRFEVENFGPLTVAIDAHGHSRYAELSNAATDRLPEIKRWLQSSRGSGASSENA